MTIETAKANADQLAEESAAELRAQLMRNPATTLRAAGVTPNYRYFRHLAGLRGRDAKERG